jgi:hypothetical protein
MPHISIRPLVRPAAVLSLALLAACASNPPARRVWVGPRIDLKQYEIIGMVEFSSNSKGKLAELATRRFEESARRDQDMVRMVEVGTQQQALASAGQGQWNAESCKTIARQHGARTLFRGTLTLRNVHPSVQLSTFFRSGTVTASVEANLDVEMIEAETGASIWSRSSSATRNLGQVSVFGGKEYSFDAADPQQAYGDLVDSLVNDVVRDFQGSWQTQAQ